MRSFAKIAAMAVAALAVTAAPMSASAQSWRGGDRDHDGRYERHERRADRNRYDGGRYTNRERYRDDRRYYRDQRQDYRRDYRYSQRRYYRGATLPYQYRSNWYIRDYNRYGYAPPPRGYGYYRTDTGDIVVAALATGLIVSLLNN
ncbi:MAG TPA: RcnB family protein [Brevundimonas sp.]|jgi:Ni/Co efflux regulator RcnB